MVRTIKARYSNGVIKPLEELELKEGEEVTITIAEGSEETKGEEDPLNSTFGGWVGLIDSEELKKNIYADRLVATRPEVKL